MTDLNDISVEDLVVVLDLGSSKFRAAAGVRCKDEEGRDCVELLCYISDSSQGVKRGRVYNLETSAFVIKNLLVKLENQLNKLFNEEREADSRIKLKIRKVCVGLNGKSIKTTENQVLRSLGSEQKEVTMELMESLYEEAKGIKMVDSEILKIVPQEFSIDDEDELNPIGCLANRISGRYKIVSGDVSLRKNLEACVKRAGYELMESPLSIEASAASVLSQEEKNAGCAIFDFGGGTTSVAVYSRGVLRNLLVAPFGGNVITSDIASLKMPEGMAERLKVLYGSTLPDKTDDVDYVVGNITVNSRFLSEIIESRMDEIFDSIWQYLESTHALCHINEIVLTGSASKLKNLQEKIVLSTGVDVRIGKPNYGHVLLEDDSFKSFASNPEFAQVLGLLEMAGGSYVQDVTHVSMEEMTDTVRRQVKKPVSKTEQPKQKGLFDRIKSTIVGIADSVYYDEENKK